MKASTRNHVLEWMVTAPSFFWLGILFLIPTLLIFAITFHSPLPDGGIGSDWTLDTLKSLGNPNYPAIIWRTIWLSPHSPVPTFLLGPEPDLV